MAQRSIPVTILTGYLGAGKTTLLNYLLTQDHGKKIAVIVNEFGQVGIDNQLVAQADEEIIAMNNGSICCTVRKDLIRIIQELLHHPHQIEHILIETTGLADPAPVVQTFFVEDGVKTNTHLEAVVTVIDAKHIQAHWDAKEVQEQVLFANVILLNKTDLVTSDQLDPLESKLRSMNPLAKLYRTQHSQIGVEAVLGLNAFDVDHALAIDENFLSKHVHEHDKSVSSVSLTESGTIDLEALTSWLHQRLNHHAADTFRVKGIFNVADQKQRYVMQGVHSLVSGHYDRDWQPQESHLNELVFIGRNLEAEQLREEFQACFVEIQ
ncbi:CobW family GTP-binding protein [Leptolyngbya sp. AN03gr2]|uniref:CobW family GTP-binding protein n=1 Tax=unclassified Leptolyngbya TaxID=2650499 RepID=UPI003D311B84